MVYVAAIALLIGLVATVLLLRAFGLPRLWRAALRAAPLRVWVLIGAGPVLTACAIGLTFIVKDSSWPLELRGQQLTILGWTLGGAVLLLGLIVITMAAVRVKASGPGGTHLEVDGRSEDHQEETVPNDA